MNLINKLETIETNLKELKKSVSLIEKVADICINAIKLGGKIIVCGNGGSAADAQHFAAELVVKYKLLRKPIPAIALTTDTSILTAIGNDFGAEYIFVRQLEALASDKDVFIGITTSGNSENVVRAFEFAKENNIKSIALTGHRGGKVSELADISINVPSEITNNIQEMHLALGHMLCGLIEESLFHE